MKDETRAALTDRNTWLQLPTLLLFFLLLVIVTPVLVLVSLVGWVMLLVTGERSEGVTEFGQDLAEWYAQTARYLTGGAERRPFPFEDLDCPRDEPMANSGGDVASHTKTTTTASRAQPAAEKPDRVPETTPSKTSPETPAARKSGSKKTSSKKTVSKKASGKKSTGKKTSSKKSGSRKSESKKSASKKKTTSDRSPAATESTSGDSTT